MIALVVGYLSGGRDANTKRVFGLSTANRNISAGILISGVNFIDRPLLAVTVMIVAIVSLVLLMIVAGEWGRKTIDNITGSKRLSEAGSKESWDCLILVACYATDYRALDNSNGP